MNMNNRHGFTLLEVLIALAITGGALATIIYTLNYHLSILQRHEIITRATLMAEDILLQGQEPEEGQELSSSRRQGEEEGYEYSINERETGMTGIALLEVSVRKDRVVVTLRRFVQR